MKGGWLWFVVLCTLSSRIAQADDFCTPCGGNCGESLGALRGVDAFSNGARGNCTGTGRGFYQCVEYAKRSNGRSGERWGNANQIFGRAVRLGLRSFRNGESEAPRQGDAITFQGGRYGHVAIIYEVGSNFITLVEQNWHNIPGRFRRLDMGIDGGRYAVVSDSRNYTVEGWLRSATDPTLTDDDDDGLAESDGDCDDGNANVHPGAEERCNGVDDNCVNGIDEEPAASTSCEDGIDCTANFCTSDTHVCSQFYVHDRCEDGDPCTTDLCTLVGCRAIPKDDDLDGFIDLACGGDDCDDGNFAVKPGAAESCNHADDNCDGETDEDWRTGLGSDLGNPCAVGFGVCRRSGIWDCEPAGRGVVCYAEYVSPTGGETCDGLDDDCDDETDEDWPELGLVCGTPPCEGVYVCASDGLGTSCNVAPGSPELCDGVDNDCDGVTDESPEAEAGCDDGRDCTEDVCLFGLCQNVARDRDHDTHADDLCGGDDCNDLNPAVWSYAFAESRLTNSVGESRFSVLVWNGTELGIAWRDRRDGNPEIYFARADTSLTKIGDDTRVTVASDGSSNPSLVWTGSEYGLAWDDQRSWSTDIYFTRLNATGSEIGDDVPLTDNTIGNSSYLPSIAWTGSEFGIAFVDNRGGPGDIYLARLNSSGIEIGSETPLVSGFAAGWYPNFVWTGTEYGLAWNITAPGAQEVLFAHFTPLGSMIGSVVPIFSFAAGSVMAYSNLVWQGREFALVWPANPTGNGEIYFSRVDTSGVEIGSEIQITSSSPDNSATPAIAWRGSEYGLTWEENPSSLGTRAYFVRLDESGDKLGSEIEISDSQTGGDRVNIVSDGRSYFLVWVDNRDTDWEIYLGRVSCGW